MTKDKKTEQAPSQSGLKDLLSVVENIDKRQMQVIGMVAERIRIKCEKEGRDTFKFGELREESRKVYEGR
jgi:hypothetical protein